MVSSALSQAPSSSPSPSTPVPSTLDIKPRVVCFETSFSNTNVYWAYDNPSGTVTISNTTKNVFTVNGELLESSTPPSTFMAGKIQIGAHISVNLGSKGLLFGWTIGKNSATVNGSLGAYKCPSISPTVLIETSSSSSNVSGLASFLSTELSIRESRITISSSPSSKRASLEMLSVTIGHASNEKSAILASNELLTRISTDQSFKDDLSQIIGSDVLGANVDTSQIPPVQPIVPPPDKKDEMWAGTVVGIVFASIFGTAIVAMLITTFIFRLTGFLEEKRLDAKAKSLLLSKRPLIAEQPRDSMEQHDHLRPLHEMTEKNANHTPREVTPREK